MKKTVKKLLPAGLLHTTRRARTRAAWLRLLAGPYSPHPQERTTFHAASVLVIAPHIDDEIIGAGGTLLLLRNAGAAITVAYAFSGENGQRRREAEAVKHRAGWSDLRFAGLPDVEKTTRGTALPPDFLTGVWDEIYLPHPHDNHPAHLALPRLLAPLLAQLPGQPRLHLYEVWTPLMPTVVVDISSMLDRKRELISLFASQLVDKDYLAAAEGLARYRALWLPRRGGAAEAFFDTTPSDYAALAGLAR